MKTKEIIITNPTSADFPETTIHPQRLGATPSKGLLPFQVTLLPADPADGYKDIWKPRIELYEIDDFLSSKTKCSTKKKLGGLSLKQIKKYNKLPDASKQENLNLELRGWGLDLYNAFFSPNPIETTLETKHYTKQRQILSSTGVCPDTGESLNDIQQIETIPLKSQVRTSAYKNSRKPKRDHRVLSGIHFCYVDIDFKDTHEKEVEELLKRNDAISPQVIVKSGNGLHLYWGVKHINLLEKGAYDSPQRIGACVFFKEVQTKLCQIFKGDMARARSTAGLMRVPGTQNYKLREVLNPDTGEISYAPKIKQSKYIKGRLEEAYSNPAYSLEEIANYVGVEEQPLPENPVSKEDFFLVAPSKTGFEPKFDDKDWEKHFLKFAIFHGIKTNPTSREYKSHSAYYRYLYGYREQYLVLERQGATPWSFSTGITRSTARRVREKFINELRVLSRTINARPRMRKSARYFIEDLFFTSSGMAIPSNRLRKKINAEAIIRSAKSTPYTPGERRDEQIREYGILKGIGLLHEEIAKIQTAKLHDREEHAFRLIEWCGDHFW